MQTNKQLAAGQRRKLERMSRELYAMAAEWDDVDNYILSLLDDAAGKLDELKNDLNVDNEY